MLESVSESKQDERKQQGRAAAKRRRTALRLLEHATALGFSLRQLQKGAKIDSNSLKDMKHAAPQTRTLCKVAHFLEKEQRCRDLARSAKLAENRLSA